MKRVRVITTTCASPGIMLVLPDPRANDDLFTTVADSPALVIACHPEDRERVLDHLAVAQEHTP